MVSVMGLHVVAVTLYTELHGEITVCLGVCVYVGVWVEGPHNVAMTMYAVTEKSLCLGVCVERLHVVAMRVCRCSHTGKSL